MGGIIIFTTVILYGLVIYFTYKNLEWFTQDDEKCYWRKILIYFTFILQVLCTILTFVASNPSSSALCSGGICMYIWFLSFNGFTYGTETECNELTDSNKTFVFKMVYGLICFILAICINFLDDGVDSLAR